MQTKIFDFGKVTIVDNIVIATINEGIVFDLDSNQVLLDYCRDHFHSESYGYISNRVHSYTVNPMVYLDAVKNSNIRAIAIVSEDSSKRITLEIEKQFFNYPLMGFDNIELAKNWIRNTLSTIQKE